MNTNTRYRITSVASIIAMAMASQGCIFGSGRGANSPSQPSGYQGTITLANQSGANICRVEVLQSAPSAVDMEVNLAPGQSTTFEARGEIRRVAISECETNRVLFGVPSRDVQWSFRGFQSARVVLYAAGQAPASAGDHQALEVSPTDYADWWRTELRWFTRDPDARMRDESLSTEFAQTVRAHAASERWTEEFRAFQILSSDWDILRNRRTGIVTGRRLMGVGMSKFPDGHCQAQAFFVQQAHDGSDFVSNLRFGGVSSNVAVPCALTEWFAQQPDVVR